MKNNIIYFIPKKGLKIYRELMFNDRGNVDIEYYQYRYPIIRRVK